MPQAPWWKGARGEWYVVIQLALFALIIFGPRRLPGGPEGPGPGAGIGSITGGIILLVGALLIAAGFLKLGKNLSPLPYPKEQAPLRETGPYRLVRHPIYSGGIFMAFGWGLWVHGWLTVGYAVLLFVFLDIKARREERWLIQKFPGYGAYRKRVRRLVPYLY